MVCNLSAEKLFSVSILFVDSSNDYISFFLCSLFIIDVTHNMLEPEDYHCACMMYPFICVLVGKATGYM